MTRFGYFLVISILIIVAGIAYYVVSLTQVGSAEEHTQPAAETSSATNTQIANPASVYCEQTRGGKLAIVNTPEGQMGICQLPDGTSCEEWELMRGECGTTSAATSTSQPSTQ